MKTGRRFQPGSWIDNALRENANRPFHAVVSDKSPPNCDNSIALDDLHGEDLLWQVRTDGRIPRTTDAIWECVSELIQRSDDLLFVDPHFDPTMSRFRKPLYTILRKAHGRGRPFRRIEYHTKLVVKDGTSDANVREAIQRFERDCQKETPASIPRGVKVEFKLWRQRDGGDELHARYILTERGGIAFDKGLDCGKPNETTDVRLLNREVHVSRWGDFQQGATTYDLVAGPIRVVGTCK